MLRKNIYKWHRTVSLIIAVPVILWAASGFMHPIMTNIRPKVGTQWLPPQPVDNNKIKIPLQEVLKQHNITAISNFRLVQMADNWFYQLQLPGNNVPQYISTQNGKLLKDGDALYARQLGKQFLQGLKKPEKQLLASLHNEVMPERVDSSVSVPVHDCCLNATAAIMNDTSGAKITGVELVENFDEEYKSINRLLPAYKVSFDRADGIRIYVETVQDRFSFAMDNKRAVFDKIFSLFHTMGWLDALGKGKLVVEMLLSLLAFATTLMGLYIFSISKTKKSNGNEIVKARNNHRWTSVVISLFTLMFTISGAFHAFEKFSPDTRDQYHTVNSFPAAQINFDYSKIAAAVQNDVITNISLVKIAEENYWQVFTKKPSGSGMQKPEAKRSGDLMKEMKVPPPSTVYVNTITNEILAGGEKKYATWLGALFSKQPLKDTTAVTLITKFEDEYGFVNKRLPVWKVAYPVNHHERWYVETSTGKLALAINDNDLVEGYSFSMLHKHHFMDFAGKSWRDFSTMFWAMAQIAMVAVGLTLYFKMRKRKQHKSVV